MKDTRRHLDVLCNYHDDFVARGVDSLGTAGGYSGAAFWKIHGKNSDFCLRRWSLEYPALERLQFIHAVQWFAREEGFTKFSMPVRTLEGMTYVSDGEYFWQLEPWMEGKANFRQKPSSARLVSAMTALAEFHNSVRTFPAEEEKGFSPTLLQHEKLLLKWDEARFSQMESAIRGLHFEEFTDSPKVRFIADLSDSDGPAGTSGWQLGNSVTISCFTKVGVQNRLQKAALRLLALVRHLRRPVLAQVVRVGNQTLALQPCLHDIHDAHLFFERSQFKGFIDFGSVGMNNVSLDVARMLNTLTESRPVHWLVGLTAYQSVRPLTQDELLAVQVLRKSLTLTTALRWLDFIFTHKHPVKCSSKLVCRLERLADTLERV